MQFTLVCTQTTSGNFITKSPQVCLYPFSVEVTDLHPSMSKPGPLSRKLIFLLRRIKEYHCRQRDAKSVVGLRAWQVLDILFPFIFVRETHTLRWNSLCTKVIAESDTHCLLYALNRVLWLKLLFVFWIPRSMS